MSRARCIESSNPLGGGPGGRHTTRFAGRLGGRNPPLAMERDLGRRVVSALGERATRELLEVLERSGADRAELIGRLHTREDALWFAELLIDPEDDVGEIARLRLADGLRRRLGTT